MNNNQIDGFVNLLHQTISQCCRTGAPGTLRLGGADGRMVTIDIYQSKEDQKLLQQAVQDTLSGKIISVPDPREESQAGPTVH